MQRSSVDLPRPGRADEADDLVLGDLEVDPVEDHEPAERLVQALDRRRRAGVRAARRVIARASREPRRRRSRATSQSTSRVSGMVSTRKRARRRGRA